MKGLLNKRRFRVSIFIKILFPLLAAMVLINIVVVTTVFSLLGPPRPPGLGAARGGPPLMGPRGLPFRVQEEFDELVEALKVTPTLDKARLKIRPEQDVAFQNKDLSWSTSDKLPSWTALKEMGQPVGDPPNEWFGFYAGRMFVLRESSLGKIVFLTTPMGGLPSPIRSPHFWVMLALQVAGVLLLCYGILIWQLRPIKQLGIAMSELSKGNLEYRVKIEDSGEFGLLGDGFNEMARRISDMLGAKQELLLGVSHELRSPLASAQVLIEMIDDTRRRDQIRIHLDRMESMVAELLDSHRISSEHAETHFEEVNLEELLSAIKFRYEGVAPGLVISDIDPTLLVKVDLRYFDRLLTNLIENALKYSKDASSPVNVSARQELTGLVIEVSDRGPGIPEADLANIFEPFYRVDKSRNRETGGFGIGLYLCTKIVALHEGTISVANRPGGGCCFSVHLPAKRLA